MPAQDDTEVESFRMIQPNTTYEHAELNHLDHENRHNDSHEPRGTMSGSFPCCMMCAACFLVHGQKERIEHLGYREDRVQNWDIPDSLQGRVTGSGIADPGAGRLARRAARDPARLGWHTRCCEVRPWARSGSTSATRSA